MNSGTFHVMSQSWRYFSKERALAQTLALGQLLTGTHSETIEVAATPPSSSNQGQGFSVPPFPIGNGGAGGVFNVPIVANVLSTCYAAVGPSQTVLARKNMVIQYGVWDDNLKEILFTPQENGWFMLHGETTSGLQNALFDNGTGTHSFANGDLIYGNVVNFLGTIDRQPIGFTATQIGSFGRPWATVNGVYAAVPPVVGPPQAPTPPNTPWNPNFYMSVITSDGGTYFFEGIAGLYFRFAVRNQSNPIAVTSDLTAWAFKIADI